MEDGQAQQRETVRRRTVVRTWITQMLIRLAAMTIDTPIQVIMDSFNTAIQYRQRYDSFLALDNNDAQVNTSEQYLEKLNNIIASLQSKINQRFGVIANGSNHPIEDVVLQRMQPRGDSNSQAAMAIQLNCHGDNLQKMSFKEVKKQFSPLNSMVLPTIG